MGRKSTVSGQNSIPPILYEDNHVLVISKPPGVLSQGDRTGDSSTLELMKAFIKKRDSKPGHVFLGLPHRLDRPASGILVLAKTSKALSRLAASFRNRDVRKIYWAAVSAPPPEKSGTLTHWLVRNGAQNKSRAVPSSHPNAREAILHYTLRAASDRYWLLEIELVTGRHHQIRAQLAAAGCTIRGDVKYGARRPNLDGGIHLHARNLQIPHPVRPKVLNLTAPLPNDPVWQALSSACETESSVPERLAPMPHAPAIRKFPEETP